MTLDASIHREQILVILLLTFLVGFGILAQRLKVAYPIVLVLGGLLVSFIPGLPPISLNPDFVFVAVLPPLLFSSAAQTSWVEFKYHLVSISSLALGLVGFTVVGVAFAVHCLVPAIDWRVGLVLGAAVAPTDAIAATAIAKRLGLPNRIVDLLEGESLVNDASGLLALQFATALVLNGTIPSMTGGALRLIYLTTAGVFIGLAIGNIVQWIESRIENTQIEIALTIVTPYLAYSLADAAGASGVLAAVAAGLFLGRKRSSLFSPRARVESHSFWSTFSFLLNGIVFLLIGLQLPVVLHGIRSLSRRELALSAALLAISVILLRILWVVPATYIGYLVRHNLLHHPVKRPLLREAFIVGWTGMRGVVSLAAALSLPVTLASGKLFPQRSLLIYLTFSTILVTLVLQGLTLSPLIRALHLPSSDTYQARMRKARRAMLSSALRRLEELRKNDKPESAPMYDAFSQFYHQRLALFTESGDEHEGEHDISTEDSGERYRSVAEELRRAERSALMALHARDEIGDGVLRALETELDLLELRAAQA